MADDGHTINVGPVTIGEPLPVAELIDTDLIGTIAIVWRANGAEATADAIEALCGEVDRLRPSCDHPTVIRDERCRYCGAKGDDL